MSTLWRCPLYRGVHFARFILYITGTLCNISPLSFVFYHYTCGLKRKGDFKCEVVFHMRMYTKVLSSQRGIQSYKATELQGHRIIPKT